MSIHDLNQKYADEKGATMLRGYDGYDNYFLLGTFPAFGARLALRARNEITPRGTKVGFKLRLMPVPGAEGGNWSKAIPEIKWRAENDERCSACFGVGLAAWTRAEVKQCIIDVDYPQVLDNWLTGLGLTWDEKQRAMLPAYLAEAEDALFFDQAGEGKPIEVEGRVAHQARHIVPEDDIYFSDDEATADGDDETGSIFDDPDEDDEGEEGETNDEGDD